MVMASARQMLLDVIKAALAGECVPWQGELSSADREQLLELARIHKLLPCVWQTAGPLLTADPAQYDAVKAALRRHGAEQTVRDHRLFCLLRRFRQEGLTPLVVKGVLCRSLWPDSHMRVSADEDLLVPPDQFANCCRLLSELGFSPTSSIQQQDSVAGWRGEDGLLYLELHSALFPSGRPWDTMNAMLSGCHLRSRTYLLPDGAAVDGLCPHDHLLYLILHACKHFIHSGFGIRQVCDIGLWARQYGAEIQWDKLYHQCVQVRAMTFAAALFQIAEEVCGIRWELPPCWRGCDVDWSPMLTDMMEAGIYGTADRNRLHTAALTRNAVEAGQEGRDSSILRSLFPEADQLVSVYPFLRRWPVSLPAVWLHRLCRYAAEVLPGGSKPSASLQIAARRKALLRHYGILD